MAVTDFWEMGVAVPIRNHKFRYGTYKSSALEGDVTSGASSVTIETTDPTIGNIAQRGDNMVLGPSTNTSYTGKSETVGIESIVGNVITLKSTTSYAYDDDDPIRVYGTRLAGGWTPNTDQGTTDEIILPKTLMGAVGELSGGKVDDYSQRVVFDFSDADFDTHDTVYAEFKYYFDSNPFQELFHYRAGAYAKLYGRNPGGDATRCLQLHDGIRNFTYSYSKVYWLQSHLQWFHWHTGDASLILPSTPNLNTAENPHFNIYMGGTLNNHYMDMYLDDVYAEHAHETTPTTQTTLPIQVDERVYVLNVMYGSEFTAGERVLLFDEANGTYGIGTVTATDAMAIYMGDMMYFYKLNGTTYDAYDYCPAEISAGSRVQQANAGYYTFTEYPLRSSLQVDQINPFKGTQLANNAYNVHYNQTDADRGTRFRIRCRFQNVPETMWEKLMVFKRWQERGHYLNLHPQWDDVPQVMTGVMQIQNIRKSDHWDLTYRSFDFVFEECLL